ncbi:hypothetical protein ACP70R_012004 [Stipagrostis hirtigluma subsp. patula]
MANRAPLSTTDGQMLNITRRKGMDPLELEALMDRVLSYIHGAIPDPLVSAVPLLSALQEPRGCGGDVDRISCLPDALLRGVIWRLPWPAHRRALPPLAPHLGIRRSSPLVLDRRRRDPSPLRARRRAR